MANKFVTFDGAPGSYISCDDVNMLDADTANLIQSSANWESAFNALNVQLSAIPSAVFGGVLEWEASSDASGAVVRSALVGTAGFAVSPSTSYDYLVWLASDHRTFTIEVTQYNSGGGQVSQTALGSGISAPFPNGTIFSDTFSTHPDAAFIHFRHAGEASGQVGTQLYSGLSMLTQHAGAVLLPSLDIVGVLDEVLDPPGFPVAYVKAQDLRIGVSYTGDIVDYQRLDGTSGPVVARMDADDIPFADGLIPDLSTWTDSSGRVWTSHGNVILSTVSGGIDVTYTEAGADTDPFSTTSLAFRSYTEAGVDTDLFDAVLDVPGAVALTFTEASTDVDSFSVVHDVPAPPIDPDDPILEIPIPPGTTWTDQTGRVWTSFGSLVMQDDSVQTVRQELIKFLRLHHSNWQFYDYPPEVLSTPAVLINPSDPYIEPFTQGPDGPSAVIWGIDLTLVTKRAQPQSSLLTLEFMFTSIQETLRLRPNIRWIDFSDVGSIEVAGVTYLSGVLSVAIMSTIDKTN